jgi:hypothetical protein
MVLSRPLQAPEKAISTAEYFHPGKRTQKIFFLLTEFHHVQARAKQEVRQFDVAAHLFVGSMSFSDHACSSYE